jgi:hypothetical protein
VGVLGPLLGVGVGEFGGLLQPGGEQAVGGPMPTRGAGPERLPAASKAYTVKRSFDCERLTRNLVPVT